MLFLQLIMENQDRKRELIIEAAVKRFAHYGLAKTTMTEIASDLSLSKALLYYYFPDKIHLYAAVLEYIIRLVGDDIHNGLIGIQDSNEALDYYLNKRHNYLKKYYNIFELVRASALDLPAELVPVLAKARAAEIDQILTVLHKQKNAGAESNETAALLYDAFVGMRSPVFHSKKTFQLDPEVFETLLERQKMLGAIFLKGLTI